MKKIIYIIILFINLNLNSQTNYSEAYFASGCFWCVESIYESLNGVSEVQSGYSGGKTKNPDYYQVLTGKTGHAETVKVKYDSKKISFKKLVEVFFASHDPTTLEHIIDQLHFIKMIQKKILSKMKFKDYWIIKFIKELSLK